jgi:PAS domain S-box-containing protein
MTRPAKSLIERLTPPNRLKAPQSYLSAVLLVLIGALIRTWLPGVLSSTPFLAFYPILVFAAALGGFGPGVLALVLSWFSVTFFFDSTPGIIGLQNPAELGRLLVFITGGLGVSIVSEAQLRGKERESRQARELRELTQLTNLGPFMIRNEQDQIVHWSDGCAGLYGFNANQAIGRISHELLQAKFPQPLDEIYETLRKTGRWEGELTHTRSDGIELIVSSQWLLWYSASGRSVLEICTDITQLKNTEQSLRNTTEELKRSNEDLENFAYFASHDLQEPLRGINGFLTLLQNKYSGQLDGKANEYINYAVEGANRMSQLINDLLRYSRLGRKDAHFKSTELEYVVAESLKNLSSMIAEAGAEVTSDNLPVLIGDPMQLMQLFQNLIGNAIKFRSSERPCQIHIGCRKNSASWEFSVKDNGIGIEPEHYDRIFLIFRRLHTRQKYPGTGIGLAICKRIVERHGGRIWVESKTGEGSTFYFLLTNATEAIDLH